ncbi:MAG: MiaB/RimO family radical SAM methylthiotransferase [Vicinamibacterales bacterium]|nr:MiaB/RimO family radical SAM methylthiotransferase [Vicinamibacterales bacterium]
MRYAITTFGCRVNQADSLQLEMELRARGGTRAPADEADLVVVNSCSVTASADQGTRQALRRVERVNPDARVVATGCYASRAADEIEALPGAPLVIPNDQKHTIADQVAPVEETTAHRFGDGPGACGASVSPGVVGRVAFMLRVQTGCDQPCSYCVIPSTRGTGRSLDAAHVLRAVTHAADCGFHEVVLTGVHLGSYGRDGDARGTLLGLLRALDDHPSTVTYRISSLEPMDCPPDIIGLVAASGRFAPHFHLPLQHASDTVLRRMRRPYTLDVYRGAVDRIRTLMPDAAIGSDLIAGFPGETDDDAARTRDYVSGSPLTYLHVFPYSPRPGTEAARLSDRVPGPLVRERARVLRDLGATLSRRFREGQVETVRAGLTLEGGRVVLTDNYLKVPVPPGGDGNQRVRVRITSAEPLAGVLE